MSKVTQEETHMESENGPSEGYFPLRTTRRGLGVPCGPLLGRNIG